MRRACLACASAVLAACGSLGVRGADRATRELVERAERWALDGRTEAALQLVADAEAEGGAAQERFLLAFTRGWLEHRLASTRAGEERDRLLAQALAAYESALALRPDDLDAQKNRVLVLRDRRDFAGAMRDIDVLVQSRASAEERAALWLVKGDLLSAAGNPARDVAGALAAYAEGRRLAPGDPAAAWRLLRLRMSTLQAGERDRPLAEEASLPAAERLDPRESAVLDECRAFEDTGLRDVARAGYEGLMWRCGDAATRALELWVELEARHDALSTDSLARLPAADACPEIERGMSELRRLVEAPELATRETLPYWTATEPRLDAIVAALHAAARAHEAKELVDEAARIYDIAWALAGDRRAEHLDLALDLAIFFHAYRSRVDPERARLEALVAEPPLADFSRFDAPDAQLRPRTSEEMQRAHTVLGSIFGEIGAWQGQAQLHLERARAISAASARGPQPQLASAIAAGLSANADPLDSHLAAAREYVAGDAIGHALAVYEAAAEHARSGERKLMAIEELVYPRRGWYAGISGGLTFGHVSSAEFQQELLDLGHQTSVDLDDERYGAKVFVGYRFDGPLALELGYTSLEGPSSTITELSMPPQTQQLLDDIADEHPIAGRGVTLAARCVLFQRPRFEAFATLGGWVWESTVDIDLHAGGAAASIDRDGADVFLGVGAQTRLNRSFALRAELERYELDGDPVDFVTLGVVYKP